MANKNASSQKVRPKWWPRIGPGLVLAVLAGVAIWRWLPAGSVGPPHIVRSSATATTTIGLSAPDPVWLLGQRDALNLSVSQTKRLAGLQTRWDRDTQELREALERARAEFAQTAPPQDGGGATLQQIEEQAAPVSHLTRQLLEARRAWWGETAVILTPTQRQQAELAWAQRFTPKGEGSGA